MTGDVAKKALAFELSKKIDQKTREQLLDEEHSNRMEDVAWHLTQSHTPGWVFYGLKSKFRRNEVTTQTIENLIEYLDDEKIQEVAEKYAETEGPIINLNNPISQNWMSENPEETIEKNYHEKLDSLEELVFKKIQESFSEYEEFQNDALVEKISTHSLKSAGIVKIGSMFEEAREEINKNEETNFEEPVELVAEWIVSSLSRLTLMKTLSTDLNPVSDKEMTEYRDMMYESNWLEELENYDDPLTIWTPR